MAKTKRHSSRKNGTMKVSTPCCEITFHGLEKMKKKIFEKFGYMILAKKRGEMEKLSCYLTSIERLKKQIEHKLTHVHCRDRKDDLEIMLHNISVLQEHADIDLRH